MKKMNCSQFFAFKKGFPENGIIISIIFLLALLNSTYTYSQTQVPTKENTISEASAHFALDSIQLKSNERFISNALLIVNNKSIPIRFTIEVMHPDSWKMIGKPENNYEIPPGDSLVVPVRLIPSVNTIDGIVLNIQALLISDEQALLADASFTISRKKNIRWKVESDNGNKIYFPINDSIIPFSISVNNEGNEKIDLLLSKKQLGNKILVEDVSPDLEGKNYHEINLEPLEDTTLNFNASLAATNYNNRRIDVENYSPTLINEEMRNTLFFQSQLSNNSIGPNYSGSRRLDFIKLTDQKVLNPYGSARIPLIVDANMYNILGIQPMLRVDMRGSTMLSNQAILGYQTQFNFSKYSYDNPLDNDLFWRITYNNKKAEVQIGNVSGGLSLIPISGRGISGSYFFTPSLRAGAYYVQNNKIPGDLAQAVGGFMRYQFQKIGTATIQVGNSRLGSGLRENNFATFSTSIRVFPNHQISLGFGVSENMYPLAGTTTLGYFNSAGYNGSFFKKKAFLYVRGTRFSDNYGSSGLPSANASLRTGYTPGKNWSTVFQSTYNEYKQFSVINNLPTIVQNKVSYNQLFFNFNKKESLLMPSIFYNLTDLNKLKIHYRGLGFDYSKSSNGGTCRVGLSIKGGFSKFPDYPEIKDYFTFQFAALTMLKTLSFNCRYYYGPQYVTDPLVLSRNYKYPQSIFFSATQQWQPRNKHFIIQGSANYSYMNQFNRNSLGIYPEVYYFTNSKWRFKISPGYSINSSRSDRSAQEINGIVFPEASQSKVVSQNFYLNAGVRKEFGIPVPKSWSKRSFTNLNFTAFLDANGNKIKDKNEVIVKNVVIKIGNEEVITNEEGKASFINTAAGAYSLKVWSLYELNGWFPLVDDSLFTGINQEISIPFIKGIKLAGNVILQKERYSGVGSSVDLSRILITAIDASGKKYQAVTDNNGMYTLYLPPGKYLLNMDEGFVGKGFIILKNNADVSLIDIESYNYNFYILEKKRKMNIKKFGDEEPAKK